MESIMIKSGSNSIKCLKICCVLVSVKIYKLAGFVLNRSARNFICCSDSSPVTYKTLGPCKESATCSNNVDLPIPGSPPISTKLPGTIPPPNTRLNSGSEQINFGVFSKVTSASNLGFTCDLVLDLSFQTSAGCVFVSINSSTKVFHSSHEGHFPSHLGVECPQD